MSAEPSRMPGDAAGLRTDARRNRDRIIEVARELFAGRGLDVPMATIARRAGVGVATLYRRFPTKDSLVIEVFADQFAACAAVVDEGLADPDPWRGFCAAVERLCAMQIADRGFSAAFLAAYPDVIDVDATRERALRGATALADRAKAAGRLRADFAPDDLLLLLTANSGIAGGSAELARAASRRLVAYLLNSFRADHADPAVPLPPPAPLSVHDVW
ncbi:TetR/AcrR family transcriptional regulator [Allonocardiopsis opalescens]|uniref:TetR family transcriptional regulator n=1 Tax=Allonocardiopsis opalescens TaxID=1144618 RepID=A0A2T0Q2X2_9ACTN|nr:TetR/AcrR family transcriptional regulator [Allonocardiopsis opalescens]PRX98136.1 TetR family transcriptional regulator [Allonocardiopsis opalescens]